MTKEYVLFFILPRTWFGMSGLWDGRFTPLETPGIYAGDVRNRKDQLLIEGGGKALPFLTGFTS